MLSGWVNRRQQEIIDFQNAQIRTLMEQSGKKRILLTDDQRRLLAVKGKAIGRKALMELTTVVTPDTIMRWHRRLVAKKWDYSDRRKASPGRPPMSDEVVALVLRMARENPTWGFDKIKGAIANLGYEISDTTVGNILREHGIEPAPERRRQTTWKTFLRATGRYSAPSTSRPSRSGPRADWSPTTFCSSWNCRPAESILPDAPPTPTRRG
jgi:transposase